MTTLRHITQSVINIRPKFLQICRKPCIAMAFKDSKSSIGPDSGRFLSSSTRVFKQVSVNYVNRDGTKETVKAEVGDTLLDVVIDNDLDIEGYGACEGTLACSTCHLILEKEVFDSIPEPTDEELDMLDLAYGLTDLSRLGCQIEVTKEIDGATFVVPEGVADARDV